MKNIIKRILFSILFLAMFIIVFVNKNIKVYAFDNYDLEKVFCNATLFDDFSDNEVLIILNKQLSRDLSYNATFENIDYICIEDLTDSYDKECELNEHFRRIYKMTLRDSNKEKVLSTIKQLEELDFVYCAEPNYYDKVASIPNDYISSIQYAIENINLPDTWNFMVGNNDVTVGVIDTGIDGNNPDLQENLNIDLSRSFSADFTSALEDLEGHGTHVAGIIGAVGNNNVGITGSNWNVSIVSLRVANSYGELPIDNVIAAINYAHEDDVNIDILNYSGGGYNYSNRVETRRQAIANYDGLFVCAAGNDKINTDVNLHYPSSHNLSNLISVGSLDQNNNRSTFSNFGLNTVDIYAPGSSILSTYPIHICNEYYQFNDGTLLCELDRTLVRILNYEIAISEEPIDWDYIDENFADIVYPYISGDIDKDEVVPNLFNVAEHLNTGYHYMDGTSMATPYVAGVAALLLSLNEELTAIQLRQAILESAEEITITVPDTTEGAEEDDTVEQDVLKLNAYNAVRYVLENYMNPTTHTLSNFSNTINTDKVITSDASYFDELNGFYKLNVTYAKSYEFLTSSSSAIEVMLYDEDFTEIPFNDLDSTSNKVHFIESLSMGTYYLRIKYTNEETIGTINTKIVSRNTTYLNAGKNDILINSYNNISSYVYGNSTGKGFYKITLSANTSSGVITYPESCIKIYKDFTKQELVTRLETIYYTLPANTSSSSNNLIVFLDQGSTYYIDIIIPNDIYSIVSLDIEKIEDTYEINMFNNIEGVYEEEVLLENDETQFGDYIQKIEIKQKGIYGISFIHDGPQSEASSNFLYYALYKELVGPPEEVGNVEMLLPHMTTTMGGTITYEFILDKGVYYIGYYNKFNYESMSITIKYQIDIYDSNKIITDPDLLTDCGSMINIYEKNLSNKSYRGKTIVVGFTRILYLDPILEIDTRTDYSWYSSNEDIATVSDFGTVFAKSPGTVKIMAVSKEDLKIVYIETFTIINDNSTDTTERIININDTHSVSDGDYLVGLTVLNSPYPSAYLYDWEILSYDETITRIEYIGSGYFVIEGFGDVFIKGSNYAYNNKYSIKIYLNVTQ